MSFDKLKYGIPFDVNLNNVCELETHLTERVMMTTRDVFKGHVISVFAGV